jgi:hypothetical protein
MEYRETAIQLLIIIVILVGILIKLIGSIIIGIYRDLTVGYQENELTFFHKIFYVVLSIAGLAIVFAIGFIILSGGLLMSIFEVVVAIIIGILIFS